MSAAIAPTTPEQVVGETVGQVRRETLRQILRSKTVWVGIVISSVWTVCALFGSRIAPQDPFKTDPIGKHKSPSAEHYFGTDLLGRDIFSRIIVGARDILTVAPLATLLGTLCGTALGLAMGYFRGWTDDLLSRVVEAILAIPLVIVAITALAATGASTVTLIVVIAFVFTPIIARTVRAAVLAERELEYVTAARLRGERSGVRALRRDPAQRHATDPGRVHGPDRVRHLRHRHPLVPRVRATAAVARLGPPDRGRLPVHVRRLLVGVAVPGARHRIPRDRREPHLRRRAAGGQELTPAPVIDVRDLEVAYRVRGTWREVLRGISFSIGPGESFGLVGESGCGKSTAAMAAMRYLAENGRISGGSITVDGQDLVGLSDSALRELRSRTVSMVYQDPTRALNPSLRIDRQLSEVFELGGASKSEAADRSEVALRGVQIADPGSVLRRYPHQLSGGMAQRVVIAMALAVNPKLLVLDEPTTALDATVEAEVLDLVARLRIETNTAVLFISHNLGVIAKMCDRVGVLYAGAMVEEGTAREVFDNPRHPYTVGLLRCIPRRGQRKDHGRLDTIPGFLPPPGADLPGCVFVDRCAIARDRCRTEPPPAYDIGGGRRSRCHYHEEAPDLPRRTPSDVAMPAVVARGRADPARGRGGEDVQAVGP